MFGLISHYFWAIALLMTCINFSVMSLRARRHAASHPELAAGYRILLRGYVFWISLPWLVMAAGCTVGGVPSVWHYFRPGDHNPYVLAW